ncbi:MAG: hypothetical protein GX421_06985 [Caldisericales bacterium]|nr:hypothetical protein [Caldisericales bacterium]
MKKQLVFFLTLFVVVFQAGFCFSASAPQKPKTPFEELSSIGAIPPTIHLSSNYDQPATIAESAYLVTSVLDWAEQYRISATESFWMRIWFRMESFLHRIRFDFEELSEIASIKGFEKLSNSKRWGISFEIADLDKPVTGWQVLEMESFGLSEALLSNGIQRTLREEVDSLLSQIASIKVEMAQKFADLKIEKERTSIENEVPLAYFLFALQHDLLPETENPEPSMLEQNLTKGQLLEFAVKAKKYLQGMVDDISGK